MLIDSCIIGGIAAFAAIGGNAPNWETLWIAFKAFGISFLMQLAIERGIKRLVKDAN
uniref:Holin n=1 Tax=viral metagenome TaxID=1070528 RepID=A0A6H1ZXS5_9ZZZZ